MITEVSKPSQSRRQPLYRRILARLLLYPILAYALILVLLLVFETSLVYPGSKYPRGDWSPRRFAFEEIEFQASDSTHLVGWFLPRPTPVSDQDSHLSETILLCHGNAENVAQASAYMGDKMRETLNADVFVFDYRGYGKSDGTPFEEGVLDDAESALKLLCERTQKKPEEITLVGHSLGGGPACHLAGKYSCKALVLQRTFSSIVDAGQANYPIFPVRYLMRNRFPSAEKIKNYSGPLFQSHGSDDEIIPIHLARELFANAATGRKQFYEVSGMKHFDPLPVGYWVTLRSFFVDLAGNQTIPPLPQTSVD
jgi:fermentation-respiration switch protein FrsA (DUF1100 family)